LERTRTPDTGRFDQGRHHAHSEGDDTLVRLVHSGLPEDAITDHENGWQFFLDRLATVAVGGELVQ